MTAMWNITKSLNLDFEQAISYLSSEILADMYSYHQAGLHVSEEEQ